MKMRVYDQEDAERINAEQWQLDLLKLNPEYVHWGPYEDYMIKESGWDSRQFFDDWDSFGPWELDDLNECVNFYFSVERKSEECKTCRGNGYHPDAQNVVNTFYAHMNDRGIHWNDKITQDELDALVKEGRIKKGITLEEVNNQNKPGARGFGHDAINRMILTEARLKRLGIPRTCPDCDGHGYVYVSNNAHVTLTLWMLHPRKGCSRGVEISKIEQDDLPRIFDWLKAAARRNSERFSKIQEIY